MIRNILRRIGLWFWMLFVWIDMFLNMLYPPAVGYIRTLLKLTTIAAVIPLPVIVIGIVMGWPLLTTCAGLWCIVFSIILAIWGTPIGVLLDSVLPRNGPKKISGERYINIMGAILFGEMSAYIFLSLVPIRNNLVAVPIFTLIMVWLFTASKRWGYKTAWLRPLLYYVVMAIAVMLLVSFFFPKLTMAGAWDWTKTEVWGWYATNVPYPVLVAICIVLVFGLIALKAFGPKSTAHAAGGGHSGGHEHGGNRGWIIFLLFLVLGGIVWPAIQMVFGWGQGQTRTAISEPVIITRALTPSPEWHEEVLIKAGMMADIPVTNGWTCRTTVKSSPTHPNPVVWVRWSDETKKHPDWIGANPNGISQNHMPDANGIAHKFVWVDGQYDVWLEVHNYQTPER